MATRGLKTTGTRHSARIGEGQTPVRLNLPPDDGADAASWFEEELEAELEDHPYYTSWNPGRWERFRAWFIYFFQYFVFLFLVFIDWLRRSTPWAAQGLWTVCKSRKGRWWIAGLTTLRVAIFFADFRCEFCEPGGLSNDVYRD